MSNQAADLGIEDVLSSIRKLVSNEGVPEPRPVAPRRPKKANKLVLTPALRVTEPVPEAERRVPPERGTAVPWTNPRTTLYEAAQSARQTESETPPSKPRPMLLRPEDAVPNDKVAWIRPKVVRDERPDREQSADEFSFRHNAETANPTATPIEEPLSKKIEALEAAIARTEDQWEPDGTTNEEYSGTKVDPSISWRDRAPEKDAAAAPDSASQVEIAAASVVEPAPEVTATPETHTEDASQGAAASQQDPVTADGAVLDEESLRVLVAEILREELQGVLGERITRNVRKLVRREIQRALTARDLG